MIETEVLRKKLKNNLAVFPSTQGKIKLRELIPFKFESSAFYFPLGTLGILITLVSAVNEFGLRLEEKRYLSCFEKLFPMQSSYSFQAFAAISRHPSLLSLKKEELKTLLAFFPRLRPTPLDEDERAVFLFIKGKKELRESFFPTSSTSVKYYPYYETRVGEVFERLSKCLLQKKAIEFYFEEEQEVKVKYLRFILEEQADTLIFSLLRELPLEFSLAGVDLVKKDIKVEDLGDV